MLNVSLSADMFLVVSVSVLIIRISTNCIFVNTLWNRKTITLLQDQSSSGVGLRLHQKHPMATEVNPFNVWKDAKTKMYVCKTTARVYFQNRGVTFGLSVHWQSAPGTNKTMAFISCPPIYPKQEAQLRQSCVLQPNRADTPYLPEERRVKTESHYWKFTLHVHCWEIWWNRVACVSTVKKLMGILWGAIQYPVQTAKPH